ncbi:MAG: hypothetical protein LBR70_02055 [Lactobacillaceae bacterium]|jgi:4-hydroxy-tetrahydrodipicolinate reductase|nr:hypothetical protein [Lactobacillaceae bacterium]
MHKVLLNGADGKMGAMIADIIRNNPEYDLEVSVERTLANPDADGEFDIIIDFSVPSAVEKAFELAKKRKKAYFTGVTGLSDEFLNKIKSEKSIPVFYAANASLGVFYFGKLIQFAKELYKDYDAAMREAHHIHKKDAPSGTAKTLAGLIDFPYDKIISLREGEIVGTHEVVFETPFEEIRLSHIAHNRKLFAESAVIEAVWLTKQKPGFYGVGDYYSSTRI